MSKQFSRGSGGIRRGGGNGSGSGGGGNRRVPLLGTSPEEKQRQSVFDRLGTRRVNVIPVPHYGSASGDGPSRPNKNVISKSSERNTGRQSDPDRESHGRSKTRSRSPAKHRMKASESSTSPAKKVSLKSVVSTSRKDRNPGKASPSVRHHESSKQQTKSKSQRESGSSSKHRTKVGESSTKSKKISSGSGHQKSKHHGRSQSPSESSEETSSQDGDSTSSTSNSSSSSGSDGSTSSSSEDGSSDTDSSVPSIKLKPVKKAKVVKKKKPKNKMPESRERERSKKESEAQRKKLRPESISSPQVKSHSTGGRRNSPESRGNTKDRDFVDKRSAGLSKSGRADRDRVGHHFSKTGESGSGHGERHVSSSRSDRYEEPSRKRQMSGDNYDSPNKKSRVATPPDRLKNARRTRSPSPPSRISDSHMMSSGKRERSPLLPRPRIASPLTKRPLLEDPRRGDLRRDVKPRYAGSPVPLMKPKEDERERDRPFQSSYGNTFGSPNFNRDERQQRERYAPSRGEHPGPRERLLPSPKDRRIPGLRDVEPIGRRAPLLPFPSDVRPSYQYQNTGMGRASGSSNFRKHSPMIVKTKEALIEKYDESRQSRVDMWVDETLRGGSSLKRSPTPPIANPKDELDRVSPGSNREKRRSASFGSAKDDADILSDFSDDADDILTKEVCSAPKEIKSDNIGCSKRKSEDINEHDMDSDVVKVTSSNLHENLSQGKVESVKGQANLTASIQSQSQTDDDLLEGMDFEEISDEELGEAEHKVGIVDALGVDWSSLVCRDKTGKVGNENIATNGDTDAATAKRKLKDKYSGASIFRDVGLCRDLVGDELFEKVFGQIQEMEERNEVPDEDRTTREELENPSWRRRRLERKHLLEDVGIGPYNRVLSGRRDLACRRYLLGMIPKSLASMDMLHQTAAPKSQLEADYIRSLQPKATLA